MNSKLTEMANELLMTFSRRRLNLDDEPLKSFEELEDALKSEDISATNEQGSDS